MNYSDLASRLSEFGERLAKHAHKLEGQDLGKSAGKLAIQLDRFEEHLESYLASRKSGELLLEILLHSPSSKRHLTVALLKNALRKVCGKRLKAAFAEAVHVEFGGKEKAQLQREFIRLGRLLDEEFAKEVSTRTFGEL